MIMDSEGGTDYSFYYAFQACLNFNGIHMVNMNDFKNGLAKQILKRAVDYASNNYTEMEKTLVLYDQTLVEMLVSFCLNYDFDGNFTRNLYVPSGKLITEMREAAIAYTDKPEDKQWKRLVDSYGNYSMTCDPHANEITQAMIAACYNVQFKFYHPYSERIVEFQYKIGKTDANVIAIGCNKEQGVVYRPMLMSADDLVCLKNDDKTHITKVENLKDPSMHMCQKCGKPNLIELT